jgi:hypothetical protein
MKPPASDDARACKQAAVRAAPGSLAEEAAFFLKLLNEVHWTRARVLRGLLGRNLALSEPRILLMRYVLLEFAAGRTPTMAAAQDQLAVVASENTIRAEAVLLEDLGVIALERTGSGRTRQTIIWPTERMVRWYNRWLITGAKRLLRVAARRSPARSS